MNLTKTQVNQLAAIGLQMVIDKLIAEHQPTIVTIKKKPARRKVTRKSKFSKAQRLAISRRMRKMWAAKRKGNK